ncbi:MAG: DUF1934 domain-containing protein [Frisingicoccus sp.]|uniref:DUF1934 domain-containing protein n=1 Tax=Frisingicoccus sp. TaxID=1918627 RepID=UPI002A80B62F|nr:DUF1934 domain-containing protein [Frisingicoccus sp.]MDY4835150.1 DUF1934 domain-containing protein [Frisingicoccus sp.]
MTNEVILSIKGIQHEYGDDGITEIITTGNYYFRNGKHYIVYDELIPETGEQVSSTLKMTPKRIDMIKHGSHSAHMVFETNTKNMSLYRTPYGMMEVCFNTFSVELEEQADMIRVQAEYALEINDGFISDCTIEINVRAKQ